MAEMQKLTPEQEREILDEIRASTDEELDEFLLYVVDQEKKYRSLLGIEKDDSIPCFINPAAGVMSTMILRELKRRTHFDVDQGSLPVLGYRA